MKHEDSVLRWAKFVQFNTKVGEDALFRSSETYVESVAVSERYVDTISSSSRYSGTDRLLGGAWMLASYVLMQYFTGDLKANSVMQSPTFRIRTPEDLVEHREKYKVS